MDSWFSEEVSRGFVFLSLLSFLGLLGPYALRGRHRTAVMLVWCAALLLGCACLAAAIVALIVGQPEFVVRPLAVSGLVLTVVFAGFYRMLTRAYQEAEVRKIVARDL